MVFQLVVHGLWIVVYGLHYCSIEAAAAHCTVCSVVPCALWYRVLCGTVCSGALRRTAGVVPTHPCDRIRPCPPHLAVRTCTSSFGISKV